MATVVEGAAVVQAGLFDNVAHVVHELRSTIPTRLNIAGRTDVMVRARDMRPARCPALGDVSRHFIATVVQEREKFLELAGVGWMHGDVEAIRCLHRHHRAVAIGIEAAGCTHRHVAMRAWYLVRRGRGHGNSCTAVVVLAR